MNTDSSLAHAEFQPILWPVFSPNKISIVHQIFSFTFAYSDIDKFILFVRVNIFNTCTIIIAAVSSKSLSWLYDSEAVQRNKLSQLLYKILKVLKREFSRISSLRCVRAYILHGRWFLFDKLPHNYARTRVRCNNNGGLHRRIVRVRSVAQRTRTL